MWTKPNIKIKWWLRSCCCAVSLNLIGRAHSNPMFWILVVGATLLFTFGSQIVPLTSQLAKEAYKQTQQTTVDKSTAGRVAQQPPQFGSLTNGLLCCLHKSCVIVRTGTAPATGCYVHDNQAVVGLTDRKKYHHIRQILLMSHHKQYCITSPHIQTEQASFLPQPVSGRLHWHAHRQIIWLG